MRPTLMTFAIAVLSLVFLSGCDLFNRPEPPPCPTTQYGDEIVEFRCVGQDFGDELEGYLDSHPDLRVEALSGDGTGNHGRNMGFWVVFSRTPSAEGYRQGL